MIGGPQGSGVDSAANMMGRACALGGLWVFGKREYHSNIMGLHSYFQFRLTDHETHSHLDEVSLLVTFEEETLLRHALAVVPGGGIIYDPAKTVRPLAEIKSFHGVAAEAVRTRLEQGGYDRTAAGILKEAEARGVRLFPVPYSDILTQLRKERPETPPGLVARATNTTAVAASLALLSLDLEPLNLAISAVFASKQAAAEVNRRLAQISYEFARSHFTPPFPGLTKGEGTRGRLYLTGTQAVALGKILGGCRFQSYYPITPASDESEYLEAHQVFPLLPPAATPRAQGGIVVVQTEDEIAAITMATGAALAGTRAATSTSGPGFSLMVEGLGFAGITETPVVVTLYQRGGPSTGLPTRHEQGDLRFALHAGHGEFPRIVLASGDASECLYDAVRCLNYAERYQLPVIHLVDKSLANSNTLVPAPDLDSITVDRGLQVCSAEPKVGLTPYFRFEDASPDGISPRAPIGTPGLVSWHTGDEHDPRGHIDEDPENRRRMMEKRARKLVAASREIPSGEKLSFFGPEDPETLVVSWGSTKGAILDAMDSLGGSGASIGFLQIRLLNPFPVAEVAERLRKAHKRIAVEMNHSSQLSGLIAETTRIGVDHHIVKFNGRPVSQNELEEALRKTLTPNAPKRVVMNNGA